MATFSSFLTQKKPATPSNPNSIISQAPLRTADEFEKRYGGFGSYFNPKRTIAGERARTERYYLPQLRKQIGNVREDFANRNLYRSGLRGQAEETANKNAYEQIDTMLGEQVALREKEARDAYNEQLQKFLADTSPEGYAPPEGFVPQIDYTDEFNTEELGIDPASTFGRGFMDTRNNSLNSMYASYIDPMRDKKMQEALRNTPGLMRGGRPAKLPVKTPEIRIGRGGIVPPGGFSNLLRGLR